MGDTASAVRFQTAEAEVTVSSLTGAGSSIMMFSMRVAQFEATVLAAIDAARTGHHEDDLFEFKRDWPGEDKARQLAASANRARGETLVYIIGLDDSGTVMRAGHVDPATWFAQLEARFDGPAPELLHHVRINVSDAENVVALAFDTSAAPYVINVTNGGPVEREVPLRVGARTRSAHRDELLRLLFQTVQLPRIEVLDARATCTYDPGAHEQRVTLTAEVYLEHMQRSPVFLPVHEAHAHLAWGEVDTHAGIHFDDAERDLERGPGGAPRGLNPRADGLPVDGPGSVRIHVPWRLPADQAPTLQVADVIDVRLYFGVAGQDRSVQAATSLRHHTTAPGGPSVATSRTRDNSRGDPLRRTVHAWSLYSDSSRDW